MTLISRAVPRLVTALAAPGGAATIGVPRQVSGQTTVAKAVQSLYKMRAKNSTNRAPAKTDYAGYADSNLWQHEGRLWSASRVYAGLRASWTRERLPVGSVGNSIDGGLIGCWWLRKVVPTYAGPCIKVARESDNATLDIGFAGDGSLDVGALDGFLVSSRGLIQTWYDQSGLGNNLTAAGTARPPITTVNYIGNSRAVVFETGVIYNGASTPLQGFTIPNAVTGNVNSVSAMALVKFAHTTRDAPIVELTGAAGKFAMGKSNQVGVDAFTGYTGSSFRALTNHQPPMAGQMVGVTSATTGVSVYASDIESATFAAAASDVYTGGKVGITTIFLNGASQPQNGGFAMAGLSLYSRGVISTEYGALMRAAYRDFNVHPQVRGNLVFDGDSLTEGAFQTYFNNWPRVLGDELAYPARIYNVGISGGTVASQQASLTKWTGKLFKAAPYNVVVVWVGTNDLSAGATGAATYAALKTYIAAIKATGFSVVVCTCLPRQSFLSTAKETERLAYNAAIVSGWSSDLGCIGLIDFASETTMGDTTKVGNAIYYADGTHMTEYGQSIIVNFAADALNKLIDDLTDVQ